MVNIFNLFFIVQTILTEVAICSFPVAFNLRSFIFLGPDDFYHVVEYLWGLKSVYYDKAII